VIRLLVHGYERATLPDECSRSQVETAARELAEDLGQRVQVVIEGFIVVPSDAAIRRAFEREISAESAAHGWP